MPYQFELQVNPFEGMTDEDVIEIPYRYVRLLPPTTRAYLRTVLQRIERLKTGEKRDETVS